MRLMLIGSDSVVRSWNTVRSLEDGGLSDEGLTEEQKKERLVEIMRSWGDLLLQMRRDWAPRHEGEFRGVDVNKNSVSLAVRLESCRSRSLWRTCKPFGEEAEPPNKLLKLTASPCGDLRRTTSRPW